MKSKSDSNNPLKMVKEPFVGGMFVLPPSLCTPQRQAWFRRSNEITSFQMVTVLALKECETSFSAKIPSLPQKEITPIKITLNSSFSVAAPARKIIKELRNGLDIVAWQTFVMGYGSFETYLFELMIESFPLINKTCVPLQESINILMRKSWKSKFDKVDSVFGLGHTDGKLQSHFADFEMQFSGTAFKNPLHFMDRLSEIRHRIVHASSIIDPDFADKYPQAKKRQGEPLIIELKMPYEMYPFYALLTDYIDDLFSKKFGYERKLVNPAEA